MTADLVAAALFVGVVAYAVFGGADYGCGIWDLTAGSGPLATKARRQIDHSIGPVWEANHVWLIFILVMLWTGFPRAFAALTTALAVPFSLAGLGIVLRGGAFVFRKSSATFGAARLHGLVFAGSSVLTPFFLGAIAGAVAGGRVPLDGDAQAFHAWTGPLSLVGGALAIVVTSFLAAVLLAHDAQVGGDDELATWFRRRALGASIVAGIFTLGAALTIEGSAPALAHGLQGRGAVLVVAAGVAGSVATYALWRDRLVVARAAAVVAVASVVTGWGVAQYPAVLVGSATIEQVASPDVTLRALLVVVGIAAVTVLPPLVWLFRLVDERGLG